MSFQLTDRFTRVIKQQIKARLTWVNLYLETKDAGYVCHKCGISSITQTNEHTGKDFNEKLQNSKVVIVGLGAYGSWLALHCARLGIKHIVGIDHDVVELSNLHRQVLYTKDDIGLKKAEACSKIVTDSDASVKYEEICKKIESEADLLPYLVDADFIFNAFGYYPVEEAQDAISGFITHLTQYSLTNQ